jgi:hypothetical protein
VGPDRGTAPLTVTAEPKTTAQETTALTEPTPVRAGGLSQESAAPRKNPKRSSVNTTAVPVGVAGQPSAVTSDAPSSPQAGPPSGSVVADAAVQRAVPPPPAVPAHAFAPQAAAEPAGAEAVSTVLAWAGLSSSLTDSPVAPIESPALLAVLAGWRRQSQQALVSEAPTDLADLAQTGQPVDPTVAGVLSAAGADGARQAVADTSTVPLSAPVSLVAAADTTAPTVSVTAPAHGATVSGIVALSATASDDVGVAGVQFLVNGLAVAAEDTGSPYSLSVPTTAADDGTYVVSAVARDAAGNTTTSAPVTVIVANGTSGPAVSVTSPSGPVSGLVTLTATASDADGLAGVQFLVNGAPLGAEDTTSSYSVSVPTMAAYNGTYVVTARARDTLGNLTTSAPVTVILANETVAPTVEITSGGIVSGVVTLTAAASDNVGVAGVQFLVNGVAVAAEDAAEPYSLSVLTTAADDGAYLVTAVARDAVGNTTTSAPVTFTVANPAPTAAVTRTISSLPIDGNPRSVNIGADGTLAVTISTGSGTPADPYQTTVIVLRPTASTPTTATVTGSFNGAWMGADGTVALTTYTGSGTSADPHQTTVIVLRPTASTPITATVTGREYGVRTDEQVGADGTVALTTYTGSGTSADPYQTTVTVLRDGETTPATATVTGRLQGLFPPARVGADGTVALITYTGAGTSADPYQTTVTVLRDGETIPTTATVTGRQNTPNRTLVGADGTVALTTYTGSGSAGDPYQTTVTVLRPGETTPNTATVTGLPADGTQVGADGTVAQTTRTGSGTPANPYQTTVTVLRPGETTPTTTTFTGSALPVGLGADGTVVLPTGTGSGTATDPYRITLTVLRPGETTHTTITFTGEAVTRVQVGADGTVAMTSRTGSGTATDPYRITLTVLRPGETTPTTTAATVIGQLLLGHQQVGADGTVALISRTGGGAPTDPYRIAVTVLRPDGTTTTAFTGHPDFNGVQVGADGTAALTAHTGSGTAADPYQTTVTVLRPGASAPSIATVTGYPYGVRVGADGTVALTARTGSGTATDPYVYTVSLITLTAPPTTTTTML